MAKALYLETVTNLHWMSSKQQTHWYILLTASELTNCLGLTIERILLMESPSDRPSKSINDNEQLQ